MGWARTLLRDTHASAVVNGWVSQPREWEAGVRQGCPLAPAMYLFVAWALHCWLQSFPGVGLSIAGHRLCASQYADDCVALLSSCTEGAVQVLRDAMSTFSRASGQHLNISKSSILPLGKLPHHLPPSLSGVPVRSYAHTLGITFAHPQVQHAQQQQQQHEHQLQQRAHRASLHAAQAEEWAGLMQRLGAAEQQVSNVHGRAQAALYARFDSLRGGGGLTRHQLQQLAHAEERDDEALSAQQQAEWRRMERRHDWERHELQQQHQREREAVRTRPCNPPHHHNTTPGEVDWEQVLGKVEHKCSKITRLSLSAFGRAFGVSGYALSPLLFYAEFSSLPEHTKQQVHRLVTATVERGSTGNGRNSGGVPSALHMGSPSEGGLGLLPWPQHITARHARWACHLVHHLSQPDPNHSTPHG